MRSTSELSNAVILPGLGVVPSLPLLTKAVSHHWPGCNTSRVSTSISVNTNTNTDTSITQHSITQHLGHVRIVSLEPSHQESQDRHLCR